MRPVAQVVKLNHWAVIVLGDELTKSDWGPKCDLWTPAIEQVEAAERAVLRDIVKSAKTEKRNKQGPRFIIQYYGLVIEKKKWIVCSVFDIGASQGGCYRFRCPNHGTI